MPERDYVYVYCYKDFARMVFFNALFVRPGMEYYREQNPSDNIGARVG
jgi:hypothetical protein